MTILGAIGNPPSPDGIGLFGWIELAIARAAVDCPRSRLVKRWVRYDAAGDSGGGSGDGLSESTAWLVDSSTSLKTLLGAVVVSGMMVQVRAHDWRADTGMTVDVDDCTVQGYWDGDVADPEAPDLADVGRWAGVKDTATDPGFFGTWSAGAGASRQCTTTGPVYYVKPASDKDQAFPHYQGEVYRRMDDVADVASTVGSWHYDDGTNLLTVNFHVAEWVANPAAPWDECEYVTAAGKGINLASADGICVCGWRAWGWGMEADNSQLYAIHGTMQSGVAQRMLNVSVAYTCLHAAGSTGNNSGGTLWIENCQSGLVLNSSAGSTNLISYQANGGHEYVVANHVAWAGALPTGERENADGELLQASSSNKTHTSGATDGALFIDVGTVVKPGPHECADGPSPADMPTCNHYDTDLATALAACRSFVLDCLVELTAERGMGNFRTTLLLGCSDSWCHNYRLFAKFHSTTGAKGGSAPAAKWRNTWLVNSEVEVDYTVDQSAGPQSFVRQGTSGISKAMLLNSTVSFKLNGSAVTSMEWDIYDPTNANNHQEGVAIINSVLLNDKAIGFDLNLPGPQAYDGQTGVQDTCLRNFTATATSPNTGYSYGGHTNTALAQDHELGEDIDDGHEYYNAGEAYPAGLDLEYDQARRVRTTTSAGPRDVRPSVRYSRLTNSLGTGIVNG